MMAQVRLLSLDELWAHILRLGWLGMRAAVDVLVVDAGTSMH